jgi:hypothetical protein
MNFPERCEKLNQIKVVGIPRAQDAKPRNTAARLCGKPGSDVPAMLGEPFPLVAAGAVEGRLTGA